MKYKPTIDTLGMWLVMRSGILHYFAHDSRWSLCGLAHVDFQAPLKTKRTCKVCPKRLAELQKESS